ncbi:exosporium protein D [Virgibacillus sp. SK37]|uniref:exosporium protein D n=1 Tax=Virgibacillus sp. SK37 TaxID=403957 RepID=UPI00119D7B28|nr:exosporium protein D [Virgibacillus sp. SK37]
MNSTTRRLHTKNFKPTQPVFNRYKYKDKNEPIDNFPTKKEICHIETHTVEGINFRNFFVPAGSTNQAIFEDFTCNHNKLMLTLRSLDFTGNPGSAVPLTITITKRNSSNQIIEVIPGARTRVFQVEDFESLTVSNPSPSSNGLLGVILQKTFCICCNDNRCSCNTCNPSSNNRSGNCQIATHRINGSNSFLEFPVSTRTTNQVIFEDHTCNHNKTILLLRSADAALVPLNISISTRNCPDKILEVIPERGTRVFQVEDFEKLTVSNPSTTVEGLLHVFIQKTFCICCNDEKRDTCHEPKCRKCFSENCNCQHPGC